MPRRASDSNPDGKRPCAFCRTLRVVVIFALFVVALMAYSDKLAWLENIQFTDIFAYVIAVAFVVVLVFKTWEEYWKPKKHAQGREGRREEMEKLFDEMDEAVAKREAEEAVRAVVEAGDTIVTQVTHSDLHEESINESGELYPVDTHEVSLAITVEHHEPSSEVPHAVASLSEVDSEAEAEEIEVVASEAVLHNTPAVETAEAEFVEAAAPVDDIVQESQDDAKTGQPEQLDIFGYQIKDK